MRAVLVVATLSLSPLPALAAPTTVFFPASDESVGRLVLITTNKPNGFCTDGTRIRIRGSALHFTCYGFDGTLQDAAIVLVKSPLGYHLRFCVTFQDTGNSYPITVSAPLLYSLPADVGQGGLDPRGPEFAEIRDLVTAFDGVVPCLALPTDIIKPMTKEL